MYIRQQTQAGKELRNAEVMERMADGLGNSQGGASIGAGMMLFPQMYQGMMNQQGGNQPPGNQQPKVICPHCGLLNDLPVQVLQGMR
jgi:hypothetical protein